MDDTVHCEVCALPHRRTARVCEECGHQLGSTPNWELLRHKLADLQTRFWIGVAAIIGMVVLNILLFGGAGFILALAPFAWTVFSAVQYRALAKALQAHRDKVQQPGAVADDLNE